MGSKNATACPNCGSSLFRVFYRGSQGSDAVAYQWWGRCIDCAEVWVEGELRNDSHLLGGDAA